MFLPLKGNFFNFPRMFADRQVPWVWAIHGCASLLSAVVATQPGSI